MTEIPEVEQGQEVYFVGGRYVIVYTEVDDGLPVVGAKIRCPDKSVVEVLGQKAFGIDGLVVASKEDGNATVLPFWSSKSMGNKGYFLFKGK